MRHVLLILALLLPAAVLADAPRITGAEAAKSGMGWKISVTLQHPDEGWDHYADAWEVRDMAGNVLGTRELMHPHGHNEPFTRSLSSVMIPDGTRKVMIYARCKTHGWGEDGVKLKLRP
ncbi:hypothetical protein [Pseudooceanicola sp. MF1-13]|uniref:hypothetical protein n=1 Tax=Pseudooceanicola sp. MF1-13 TaxID=3379095 RepID=UPI00389164A1